MTYYVLFFLHLENRRVSVAGITRHPDQEWMDRSPAARPRDLGISGWMRYVLHDRDTKICPSFQSVLAAQGVKTMALPARSPNLNAFGERCGRSAKEECLSKLILFGEARCPGPWPSSACVITANAIIRAEATSSFSRMPQIKPNSAATPLSVATGSEGCHVLCPRRMNSLTIREAAFNWGIKCLMATNQKVGCYQGAPYSSVGFCPVARPR